MCACCSCAVLWLGVTNADGAAKPAGNFFIPEPTLNNGVECRAGMRGIVSEVHPRYALRYALGSFRAALGVLPAGGRKESR